MLIGTGVDLIEVERRAHSIERYGERFLRRVYTDHEIAYCSRKRVSAESYAARFAAKEAGAKGLGTGISRGVTGKEFGVRALSLSLTHTGSLAMATVVMED